MSLAIFFLSPPSTCLLLTPPNPARLMVIQYSTSPAQDFRSLLEDATHAPLLRLTLAPRHSFPSGTHICGSLLQSLVLDVESYTSLEIQDKHSSAKHSLTHTRSYAVKFVSGGATLKRMNNRGSIFIWPYHSTLLTRPVEYCRKRGNSVCKL